MNRLNIDLRNWIDRSFAPCAFLLIAIVLTCFQLSPTAQAVNPAPDGGYPGNNTAEGTDALFNNTTGGTNTATGFDVLHNNTTGSDNRRGEHRYRCSSAL